MKVEKGGEGVKVEKGGESVKVEKGGECEGEASVKVESVWRWRKGERV